MLNKYAIIMTASKGLHLGANALLNSLDYFGNNNLDFYLINDFDKEYIENTKALNFPVIDIKFKDLKYEIPKKKQSIGWMARFYRWRFAGEIAEKYDSILIVDADMIFLNNIMQYFELAAQSDFIFVVNNPVGYSMEGIKEKGFELLRGASSPPVHCMPIFMDGRKYKYLFKEIWEYGLKEDFGDMTTVVKTLFRNKLEDKLYRMPNALWIQTWWYHDAIEYFGANKKYLLCAKERMNMIHGRWWLPDQCNKYKGIKELNLIGFGRSNAKLFFDQYKKFNTTWKVKLNFPYKYD